MAKRTCPGCGRRFSEGDAFAASAVSTLIPAPAVDDLATEVRCPGCGRVVTARDDRIQRAWGSGGAWALAAFAALAAIAAVLWRSL